PARRGGSGGQCLGPGLRRRPHRAPGRPPVRRAGHGDRDRAPAGEREPRDGPEAEGGRPRGISPEELLRRGRQPGHGGDALPGPGAQPAPALEAPERAAQGLAHRVERVRHGRLGARQDGDRPQPRAQLPADAVDGALRRRLAALLAAALLGTACGGAGGPPAGMPAGARDAAPPAPSARPEDASAPGDVVPEPATLHSLAVRWPVRGDANANASVAVEYRPAGETRWRAGYPLFRPHPERQSPELRVPGGWLFTGSIVDLTPDTEYEVRLALRDPDGGDAERLLRLRTAAEPREPPGMRVRHVVPGEGGGSGSESEPFRGLAAAEAQAAPGDLFLLHAGVYRAAPWRVQRQGARGRPIIYRGAGDGAAILDGGGGERVVSAQGVRHVWLEDVTLRGALYLYVGHSGSDLVVRRVRFEVTRVGFEA